MNSVPALHRGAASGMRATFQNSGTALSVGLLFSIMITGLPGTLARTLTRGLQLNHVPHVVAQQLGSLPPVSSLFAAALGINPVQYLLSANSALATLPAASRQILTGRTFFPELLSAPFHHGLTLVFATAALLAAAAAIASLLRGLRPADPQPADAVPADGRQSTGRHL